MSMQLFHVGMPISDLIFGDILYFPAIFKAFLLGTVLWIILVKPNRTHDFVIFHSRLALNHQA